jgi:hypothetical protein
MVAVIVVVGSVLALLVCSAFQLYTSRWENEGGGVDRLQMFLVLVVLLDVPCVFLPFMLMELGSAYLYLLRFVVIPSGAIPLFIGGWVALRKGPARISLPAACLLLVICASFDSFFFWILAGGGLGRW